MIEMFGSYNSGMCHFNGASLRDSTETSKSSKYLIKTIICVKSNRVKMLEIHFVVIFHFLNVVVERVSAART